MFEITPDSGPAFFLRSEYLSSVSPERLCIGEDFSDEESEDILNAALVFSAEKAALSYLGRAEHCRASLSRKLIQKGISKEAVDASLDFLEKKGLLSDRRFSDAWLRSRAINHAEGRARLSSELSFRGVKKKDIEDALDEFFKSRNEMELCKKAYQKLLSSSKSLSPDKIMSSLLRKGFSFKMITSLINEDSKKE